MKYLRNIPEIEAAAMEELVSIRDGQIISMALSRSEHAWVVLFAMAAGELISEEIYPGDTMYHVLSGGVQIGQGQKEIPVMAGEALAVGAGVLHSLHVLQDTKMLQITLND